MNSGPGDCTSCAATGTGATGAVLNAWVPTSGGVDANGNK